MLIDDFICNWDECNKVTIDILKSISDEIYYSKSFNTRFTSFSWEFACLVTTRQMYINGFLSKQINGNSESELMEIVEKFSKKQMIKKLNETNKKIKKIIKDKDTNLVEFFENKTSKFSIISWLMQHEQLHYGKLMIYLANLNIKRPKSFKSMWGI